MKQAQSAKSKGVALAIAVNQSLASLLAKLAARLPVFGPADDPAQDPMKVAVIEHLTGQKLVSRRRHTGSIAVTLLLAVITMPPFLLQ